MTAIETISESKDRTRSNGYWRALERAASRSMLSRDEENRLARLAREGDQRAFDRLVRAHLPLVFAMTFEARSHGLPADELLSEGLLGLVKAARDFDPERGARLATYAALWIRARMGSYSTDNRRIVRGPSTRNARKLRSSLRRTERALEQQLGCQPDAEAVGRALNIPAGEVEEMRAVLSARDVAISPDDHGRAAALAAIALTPEAIAIESDQQRASAATVRWALSRLEPRARKVLQRRYLSERECTFSDLSRELGISRERVRQIEVQAKQDVRAALEERRFAA